MPFPNPDQKFQPGVSGNPAGRPRGRSVGSILRELRDQTEINGQANPGGKTLGEILGERILKWALDGDEKFVRIFLDRSEGRVADALPVGDGRPDQRPRLIIPGSDDRPAPLDEG